MYSSSPFILCFTKLTFLSNGMFPISMVMGFLNILSRLIKMSNPHHHLALIASIICVGLIPDIFPSSDKETPHMPSLFADHLHNLDWVSYNCKDASEAGPFITMVSSFIINMYDVNFCISLHTKSQLDLKAWFNKHSMFFSLSFSLQLIWFSFSPAKGITLLLLCCLGLATAATCSAFQSAKWKTDVMPFSESLISQKYAEVVCLLHSGGRYGGFNAVYFLAGFPVAIILMKNNYVSPCALPSHLNSWLSSQPLWHLVFESPVRFGFVIFMLWGHTKSHSHQLEESKNGLI